MSDFPINIDSFLDPTADEYLGNCSSVGIASLLGNIHDSIEKLEAKVGVDGSAVTTSHSYKLSGVTGTDKVVSKTGTETLTNKTLTAPVITNKSSTGTDSGAETLVNKTLTAPTIADQTNMNHDHSAANKGGLIPIGSITNPYVFSVYRNAVWTTPNNAWGKVTPDTEVYDLNNNFATGTFTATVAGVYHFSGGVKTGAAAILTSASLYKNGTIIAEGTQVISSSNIMVSQVSKDIYLGINDTLELYVYTSAAVAGGTGIASVYLTGHLVTKVTIA